VASTTTAKRKAAPSKQEEGKLRGFSHDEVKGIYCVEKKLVQTLPKLANAAPFEAGGSWVHASHQPDSPSERTAFSFRYSLIGH
jgi:hypothetical protein